MNVLVDLQEITVYFSSKKILNTISFNILEQEVVTIIGPNGAGKTTLLKVVLGLLKPQQGKVIKNNILKIGYVPQKLNFDQTLPLQVKDFLFIHRKITLKAIQETLQQVGGLYLLEKPFYGLSGGEKQRVMLARALLNNPNLLVLDEPTQGIDLSGQVELYRLLKNLKQKQKIALLLVSHDLNFVMAATDKVICLNQHICCMGHPESIKQHPEYMKLFPYTDQISVYMHNHNHKHALNNDIIFN